MIFFIHIIIKINVVISILSNIFSIKKCKIYKQKLKKKKEKLFYTILLIFEVFD